MGSGIPTAPHPARRAAAGAARADGDGEVGGQPPRGVVRRGVQRAAGHGVGYAHGPRPAEQCASALERRVARESESRDVGLEPGVCESFYYLSNVMSSLEMVSLIPLNPVRESNHPGLETGCAYK